ncbi:MAG TPA: ABC transporter permease [Rhodocyclaceae bacterium]|nr:ABC transporter permease [Rhodocyclaceae bacterium]
MTPVWHLTWRSVANRRMTVALTALAVALAVAMLLGVERLRNDARAGFAQTVSGTDLIVGARSGPVQLLLYSVFHLGDATNNVSWQSMQKIAAHPQVEWLVPVSLGDSHRGFRVVGTTTGFFEHYRHGRDRSLAFAAGKPFEALFDAVVGAEVAARLGYTVGRSIVVSHGAGEVSFADHDDKPFTIVGVLARTGTPVDRSVLVGLEAIEAIHVDWSGGARMPGVSIPAEQVQRFDLTPKAVTAALVGLKSRVAVFRVQRFVNGFADEPLLAILPGVTLQQLWGILAIAERALLAVSALVVLVGLTGLVAVVVSSLGERRRELAILRAMGASPRQVFVLLALESLLISLIGCVVGLTLVQGAAWLAGPWMEAHHGLSLSTGMPSPGEWMLLGGVVAAAFVASLVPGFRAYRYSLADGMTIRI